jgi:hypothetical protein
MSHTKTTDPLTKIIIKHINNLLLTVWSLINQGMTKKDEKVQVADLKQTTQNLFIYQNFLLSDHMWLCLRKFMQIS